MSKYDKASLVMIPSGYKAEKVYSVLPVNGDGDFTFDRNSTAATRVNKDGYIETVANDIPRLNYPLIDGVVQDCPSLLLEPARTQLVRYSEDFSHSDWTKNNATITSDSVISPDGTLNASKITENTTNTTHRIEDSFVALTAGSYTQSIFAKSGNNGRFLRMFRGSGTYNFGVFNLENGTIDSTGGSNFISAKIEEHHNGWYRCSITFTKQFSNINSYYGLQDGLNDSYTGDGTSFIYIFGAQLEASSYPTSYIPNDGTSSSVTRAAETATGAGTSADFNDSEGVLMAEISALANDGSYKTLTINNNGVSDRIQISINSNNVFIGVIDGGSAEIFQSYSVSNITNNNKIAVKYKLNDCSLWINGIAVLDNLAASMPSGLSKISFDKGNGADDFYGSTKQIQYFDSALNDSELESLTSWDSFNDMATGQLYSIK